MLSQDCWFPQSSLGSTASHHCRWSWHQQLFIILCFLGWSSLIVSPWLSETSEFLTLAVNAHELLSKELSRNWKYVWKEKNDDSMMRVLRTSKDVVCKYDYIYPMSVQSPKIETTRQMTLSNFWNCSNTKWICSVGSQFPSLGYSSWGCQTICQKVQDRSLDWLPCWNPFHSGSVSAATSLNNRCFPRERSTERGSAKSVWKYCLWYACRIWEQSWGKDLQKSYYLRIMKHEELAKKKQ